MEFYTLNSLFQKDGVVDKFRSAIWTERFTVLGDTELIVDPTAENIAKLEEGKFLSLVGTDEVAVIDTALVEDGVLKVTGNMLPVIFNDRFLWLNDIFIDLFGSGPSTDYPDNAMTQLASIFADPSLLDPSDVLNTNIVGDMVDYGLTEYIKQRIPNLGVDYYFGGGDLVEILYERDSVLNTLLKWAEQFQIGFTVYLKNVDPVLNTYQIQFKAYRGRDLTRDQTTYPPVIFSSAMDTLTGVSRFRSIAGYKTVVYTWASDNSMNQYTYKPGTEAFVGFDRREHMMVVSDATLEGLGSIENVTAFLQKAGRDFLANNNYVKMLDGEIVPQSQFQFGVHYGLGDIVELDDESEITQKARITEYIRSQDETGERAYPTVSVIE